MRTFRTFCGKPLQGSPRPSCPGAPNAGAPGPGVGSKGRSRGRGSERDGLPCRGRRDGTYPARGPDRSLDRRSAQRRPQGQQGKGNRLSEVLPAPALPCPRRAGWRRVFPGHLVVWVWRWVRRTISRHIATDRVWTLQTCLPPRPQGRPRSNTTERPIVPPSVDPTLAPGRCLWPAPQRPTHSGQLQGR